MNSWLGERVNLFRGGWRDILKSEISLQLYRRDVGTGLVCRYPSYLNKLGPETQNFFGRCVAGIIFFVAAKLFDSLLLFWRNTST